MLLCLILKTNNSVIASKSYNLLHDDIKSDAYFDEHKTWNEFRKGNEVAYVKIYEYSFDILLRFGSQFCNNIGLIEDTIQDIFIDLRIKRENLPEIKYSLKCYLIRVFRNKLIRYLDREKWLSKLHKSSTFDSFKFTKSSEQILIANQDGDEQLLRLEKATKLLTCKEREAIYYYYYLDMDYAEVKEILGLKSIKSTRNLVYRALHHLRKILD